MTVICGPISCCGSYVRNSYCPIQEFARKLPPLIHLLENSISLRIMLHRARLFVAVALLAGGCSSMKKTHTARTGIEQLLISTATDRALDKIDLRPVSRAKVMVETKYLDCVDKNYIIVALHQRLLGHGCTLVDKAEDAEVILEVASGGVGTDGSDLFVGVPEIPLPPPSPIAIPRMPIVERNRSIGTAKLTVIAYDTKTKLAVINSGYSLARADHRTWNVLGVGGMNSGAIHDELANHTGELDSWSSGLKRRWPVRLPTQSDKSRKDLNMPLSYRNALWVVLVWACVWNQIGEVQIGRAQAPSTASTNEPAGRSKAFTSATSREAKSNGRTKARTSSSVTPSSLPNEQGQIWREYDLRPYTEKITDGGRLNRQLSIGCCANGNRDLVLGAVRNP